MDNRNNTHSSEKIRDVHPTELRRGSRNVDPERVRIKNVGSIDGKRAALPQTPENPGAVRRDLQSKEQTVNTRTSGVSNVRYLRNPGGNTQSGVNTAVHKASGNTAVSTPEHRNVNVQSKGISTSPKNIPVTKANSNSANNKEAHTRKLMNFILCGVFAVSVIGVCLGVIIYMLFGKKPSYSEFEKRMLEPAPAFTLTALADGSFTGNFDRFFSDNFPVRDRLVESATAFKRFYGIRAFDKDAKQVIHGDADIYSSGDLEIRVDEDKFSNADKIVIPGLTTESDVQNNGQTAQNGNTEQPSTDTNIPATDTQTPPDNTPAQNTDTQPDVTQPPVTDVQPPVNDELPGETPVDVGKAKGEKRDTLYLVGDTAYEYFRGGATSSNDYINVINSYAKYIPANVNIYDLVIPTHPEFGLEGADRAVSGDQKPVIQHIEENLDSRVKFVNAYDKLYSHYKSGEYLYFRTDHHWTIRGAYQAYEAFCETANITPVPAENYQTGRIEPFLGSFYGASKQEPALKNNPDYVEYFMIDIPCTVTRYDAKGNSSLGGLYYKRVKGESNGYLAFMGGDFPYINIQTQNMNGRKLMIFKESFGNPLIGLLAPHFQEIHVADIRYFPYNSVNFINQYGITDVLFCNGIMSANSKARVNDLLGLMNK